MSIKETISTVGAGIVGLAVVIVVLSSVVGLALGFVGGSTAIIEPAPSDYTVVGDNQEAQDLTVTPSTGTAVELASDGYVDIPAPNASTRSDGWALAVTAEPQTIDANNSYTIYAEANATIYVGYEAGNYSAWYESDSGSHGYVTAPASGGREAIGVQYNTSVGELELYLDGTQVDSSVLTATPEPRQPAYEWDGTLDEFRRYEAPIGAAGHAAYASDAVQVIDPENATHRVMFNDVAPETVYYADGDAQLVGETSLVDGVAPPTMERGVDYEVRTDPLSVRATSDGYLADAPVLFADTPAGPFGRLLNTLTRIGGSALGVLIIGLLAAAGIAVIDEFDSGM
jgi:hypothetical protein